MSWLFDPVSRQSSRGMAVNVAINAKLFALEFLDNRPFLRIGFLNRLRLPLGRCRGPSAEESSCGPNNEPQNQNFLQVVFVFWRHGDRCRFPSRDRCDCGSAQKGGDGGGLQSCFQQNISPRFFLKGIRDHHFAQKNRRHPPKLARIFRRRASNVSAERPLGANALKKGA